MVNSHGRFVWYELVTTDVEAAIAFYTKVMGWGAWDASVPGKRLHPVRRRKGRDQRADAAAGRRAANGSRAELDRLCRGRRRGRDRRPDHAPWRGRACPADGRRPTSAAFQSSPIRKPQGSRCSSGCKPGQEQPADPDAPGRVGWHELLAADWEQAWAFYGELFGWQKEDADVGEMGTYQLFSAGGQMIGGMFTKPATIPAPFWLYYFNVGDIDATAQRVTAGGGQILEGPLEVPGGSWIVRCADPQGAVFALEGTRRSRPVGYFERAARFLRRARPAMVLVRTEANIQSEVADCVPRPSAN